MTKAEAAKVLGVTQRTVQRYVSQGMLHPEYKKGSRGRIADFSKKEVENLKKQLSTGDLPKPVFVPVYHKLTLSFDEAVALSGLSIEILEEALKFGKLKASMRSGKWNIKRGDLDKFIGEM